MNKVIVMLLIACCVAVSQANLLNNPGFEDGPIGQLESITIPGWNTWGSAGWHHDDAGNTIDTMAVKLWWSDTGYWQDVDAVEVEGHTYTFSGSMLVANDKPLGVDKKGVLKVEWYNTLAAVNPDDLIGEIVFGEITNADPLDTWMHYSTTQTAPAGAIVGRIVLAMDTGPGSDDGGDVNYDNASIYEFYNQAYAPVPADDATVNASLDDLSWSNRPSGTPGDTITCDVYFEDEGIVVDPNLTDPNFIPNAPIETGVTTGTINLTTEGITLVDGHTYSWRVDTHDPNTSGVAVDTPGRVWFFKVDDTPPVVDPDVDTDNNYRYTWVDEEDGDNDATTTTLLLSGSYTDDGKSPITDAYFQAAWNGGATGTVVTIGTQTWTPGAGTHTSGTVTAPVTITNPGQNVNGYYTFWLNVTDGTGNTSDEVEFDVYLLCMEAANADPVDPMYQQYWYHGDLDADCDTDLVDFSILASYWLECMTPKAGCTP